MAGLFSVRTSRLGRQLEADREARREVRQEELSATKAAERVYEPLAQAAAEPQSRIYNIVEIGWVNLMKVYESHVDYAVASTAFLFARHFGWIEVRRQAVLASSGEGSRDVAVQKHIDGVIKVLRRSDDSEGFLFFTTEQRGIGELMLTWEVYPRPARASRRSWATPRSSSATGTTRTSTGSAPILTGMDLVAKGDSLRLVSIQHRLVALDRRPRPEAPLHRRLRPQPDRPERQPAGITACSRGV